MTETAALPKQSKELNTLSFHGTFRTYQERILKNCEKRLADGKLHIVAAPGSGKTVLGLEMIRRLNRPALILAPSITIREQWKDRFFEHFVTTSEREEWQARWSDSLEDIQTITCVTYQALYQYFRTERADDLAKILEAKGVKTLCLDEAHHLQREWWKALEQLTSLLPNANLIALTATPPYDTGDAEWKRYSDLCGEIDEEIFIPELIQEGSLCPHQDFVYLCTPEKEEKEKLNELQKETSGGFEELMNHQGLQEEIQAHPGVMEPLSYAEIFLEYPEYLTALLSYLKCKKIKTPQLKKLIGTRAVIPAMDEYQLNKLLHGILWDDSDAYSEPLREEISDLLKNRHLLRGNKMYFDQSEERDKILKNSVSKLHAIETITESEIKVMGADLRLLILTDHIRKEQLEIVGDSEKPIGEIGTVPLFELLRRMFETETDMRETSAEDNSVKIAMLTGSLAILPNTAVSAGDLQGKTITDGYMQVNVDDNNRKEITAKVTELFANGYFQVLIGTVALLGEGWDAPCVNSLILASAAATYVQSNQMRGRAIRIDRNRPDKVSSIWHLAAVESGITSGFIQQSDEFETLSRRFQAFLGVEYEGNSVSNGIDRLNCLRKPFTNKRVDDINARMLQLESDKEQIRKQWEVAAYNNEDFSYIREEINVPRKVLRKNFKFYNALAASIIGGVGLFITISERFILPYLRHTVGETEPVKYYGVLVLIFSTLLGTYGYKLVKKLTPQGRITEVAGALWTTLVERGDIADTTQIAINEKNDYTVGVALEEATVRESNFYASCFQEIYGVIDNPRYLLKEKILPGKYEYYNVPEVLGRNKKDAECFCKHLKQYHQKFKLVYTRTPEGRKELLKARARGYGNICRQDVSRKKRVKTKWE